MHVVFRHALRVPLIEDLATLRAPLQHRAAVVGREDLPVLVTIAFAPDLIGLDVDREVASPRP